MVFLLTILIQYWSMCYNLAPGGHYIVSKNGRHCIQSYLTEKQKEPRNLSM